MVALVAAALLGGAGLGAAIYRHEITGRVRRWRQGRDDERSMLAWQRRRL